MIHGDVREGLVFMEMTERLLKWLCAIDLVNILDVLCAHFVDDVWTVRFVPLVMSLLIEETHLPRLTKLNHSHVTSFRLLFKFQLSKPLLESGSLVLPSLR